MSEKLYKKLISLTVVCCMIFGILPAMTFTAGAEEQKGLVGDTYYITSSAELLEAAAKSKSSASADIKRYELMNDVTVDLSSLEGTDQDTLTFGDKDHPFCAEFDGNGKTISNLVYKNQLLKINTRNGLFSFTGIVYGNV